MEGGVRLLMTSWREVHSESIGYLLSHTRTGHEDFSRHWYKRSTRSPGGCWTSMTSHLRLVKLKVYGKSSRHKAVERNSWRHESQLRYTRTDMIGRSTQATSSSTRLANEEKKCDKRKWCHQRSQWSTEIIYRLQNTIIKYYVTNTFHSITRKDFHIVSREWKTCSMTL